jgi:hypothetical protein
MICVRDGAGWASEYVALNSALRRLDVGYVLMLAGNSAGNFDLRRSIAGSGVYVQEEMGRC